MRNVSIKKFWSKTCKIFDLELFFTKIMFLDNFTKIALCQKFSIYPPHIIGFDEGGGQGPKLLDGP